MSNLCGSGGSVPINGVLPIHTQDILHTANDGTVWLKSGNLSNDLVAYPKTTKVNQVGGELETIDVSTYTTNPEGLAVDDTHIYVKTSYFTLKRFLKTGFVHDTAYDWNVNGNHITVDGDFIYMVGDGLDKVVKYNKNTKAFVSATGLIQNTSGGGTTPLYYVCCSNSSTSTSIYVLNKSDLTTSHSFSITATVGALKTAEMEMVNDDEVYVHIDGTTRIFNIHTGVLMYKDVPGFIGGGNLKGISIYADDIYFINNSTDAITRNDYSGKVGLRSLKFDALSGLPIYIRIK